MGKHAAVVLGVSVKACRWLHVHSCVCALTIGSASRGWAQCQIISGTAHVHRTARAHLCFFAQWGFLRADLSEFRCVSGGGGLRVRSRGPC